jgi:hypothetical protein
MVVGARSRFQSGLWDTSSRNSSKSRCVKASVVFVLMAAKIGLAGQFKVDERLAHPFVVSTAEGA